jgi:hypothetical protein
LGLVSVLAFGNCDIKIRVMRIERNTINFGCLTENTTSENLPIIPPNTMEFKS